jgi:hypothetical protein
VRASRPPRRLKPQLAQHNVLYAGGAYVAAFFVGTYTPLVPLKPPSPSQGTLSIASSVPREIKLPTRPRPIAGLLHQPSLHRNVMQVVQFLFQLPGRPDVHVVGLPPAGAGHGPVVALRPECRSIGSGK